MSALIEFFAQNSSKLLEQTLEHIGLTFISLLLAVLIAVPIGIYISRKPKFASGIIGFAGVLQTIPSIALLGFFIPFLGIGVQPAILALFLYALLPILRNTFAGIQEVPASVVEAAKGMGMTQRQILQKVELPLALPIIFAGIRTATVINVGVATLAAYVGAGGLGEFIFGGISLNNSTMILAGAIPSAMLAIVFDQLLAFIQGLPAKKIAQVMRLSTFALLFFSFTVFAPQYFIKGLKAGFDPEFYGRLDGYPAIQKKYGLSFNTLMLNATLMYEAIHAGSVDIISGYATDGRIKAYDLKVLQDDRNAFPPYQCAPLVRQALLEEYPELKEVLNLLSDRLDDNTMTELNYQVDFLKRAPEKVAKEFLQSQNLWKEDQKTGGYRVKIGSKMFTEQYILVYLFDQLINGYTPLDTNLKLGLGGTKICFDAMLSGDLDLYLEYTGTGFMVILQPSMDEINERIASEEKVFNYVRDSFATQHQLQWLEPLGFNNTYALMVRKELSQKKAWHKLSDLIAE